MGVRGGEVAVWLERRCAGHAPRLLTGRGSPSHLRSGVEGRLVLQGLDERRGGT